jgi:phosphoenolpyruvate synthase/pyruvate phosphate dikinase
MKFLSSHNEKETTDLVGGKGAHLQKLVSWGAPVSPFFVVTTNMNVPMIGAAIGQPMN